MTVTSERAGFTRRRLLRLGGALLVSAMPMTALAHRKAEAERKLRLLNLHTHERLNVIYWAEGQYVPEVLTEIDYHLRDFRTGDVAPIEPKLLDTLYELQRRVDSNGVYHVISGYRSPRTNAMLAQNRHGVAKKSLHTRGMAIDLKLPGRRLRDLNRAARALKAGGVGYYPKSGFVHLDVGRVRYW